jgi:hypothetical protein
MSEMLRVIILVAVVVSSLTVSMNISTLARSTKYLKEDIELAIHDASLAVDQDSLSDGIIKFNEEEALKNFKDSLKSNSGLGEDDYQILDFRVFDHSNSTFPVEYKPPTIVFEDIFHEPTVIAIIETTTKKYFLGNSKERTIRRVASYSYKLKGSIP